MRTSLRAPDRGAPSLCKYKPKRAGFNVCSEAAARQTVTHHLDRLITTTQPAHSTIPGLPSRSSGAHGGLTGDPHRILKPRYQPLHAFLGEMNTITADLDAVDLGRVNAVWTKLFVEVDHSDVRVLANGVM